MRQRKLYGQGHNTLPKQPFSCRSLGFNVMMQVLDRKHQLDVFLQSTTFPSAERKKYNIWNIWFCLLSQRETYLSSIIKISVIFFKFREHLSTKLLDNNLKPVLKMQTPLHSIRLVEKISNWTDTQTNNNILIYSSMYRQIMTVIFKQIKINSQLIKCITLYNIIGRIITISKGFELYQSLSGH